MSIGGFEGNKKAVEPEAVFAKKFSLSSTYSFLISNNVVGVTSIKARRDQYQTGLRTRYVQLGRRPETVLKLLIFEFIFMFSPFIIGTWALISGDLSVGLLSAITIALLSLANSSIYKLVVRYTWPLGLLTVPALVVTDWFLMIRSMNSYEFGKVIWKERNICIPLLKVERSLQR